MEVFKHTVCTLAVLEIHDASRMLVGFSFFPSDDVLFFFVLSYFLFLCLLLAVFVSILVGKSFFVEKYVEFEQY
jgi:hypothetical protein